MAPLNMRRDIAMLGFLHKRMLGDTHGDICSLLQARRCTRFKSDRPSRLFQETFDGACASVCMCVRACASVCACASAWAPADGMTHLDWAVLYSGMRACYIRLRSGWGSDGYVYNVLRGLNNFLGA